MKHSEFWTCDLCLKNCGDKRPKNDLTLMNGENSRLYSEVCDQCVKRIAELLDENFPKNIRKPTQ